jgi:hypothetical protein
VLESSSSAVACWVSSATTPTGSPLPSPVVPMPPPHRSPVPRASDASWSAGGGNRRLADACRLWAFSTLTASPGARAYYHRRRAAGDGHEAALRNLANKLVGQLHHCLHHRTAYLEHLAWPENPIPPCVPPSSTLPGQVDPAAAA